MKSIQQNDLFIDDHELAAIKTCIDKRWLSEGPYVKQLGEKVSELTASKFTTFAPNGTLALYLALLALDLPRESEIIIPNFTFYASATSAIFAGLHPVFVDVDEETFNVIPEEVEKAITPKTKAIMAVHIYGQSCNIGALKEIANNYELKLIEDAAQGLGVTYQDSPVGSLGDIGIYSFFSDKVITTGEGAAVVTNNEDLFQKVKFLRNQGREHSGTFVHPELGMNFRLTDLHGAIGCMQLEKFPTILEERLRKWAYYENKLSLIPDIQLMKIAPFSNLVPFRFPIKTKHKTELMKTLEEKGIATRSFFYPLHLQPKLKHFRSLPCKNTEKLYDEGICLPVHHHLQDSDIDYICDVIENFYQSTLQTS